MRVELANQRDRTLSEAGHLPDDQIRRVEIDGWVDTGASRLVLPQWVVDQLGVPVVGRAKARLADQSTIERDVVRYVWLRLLGREGVFTAIVEPKRDDALLGAIVLEELDMIADCGTGTCHPRDPGQLVAFIE
jgi:predicted aspartyl protease